MEPQVIKMTPWHGGECPVPEGTPGIIRHRYGGLSVFTDLNDSRFWARSCSYVDIIEFAVVTFETKKPELRDLRGLVIDGQSRVWWANEEGLSRAPSGQIWHLWAEIEGAVLRADGRVFDQLRPMTPADLEVKE